MAVHVSSLDSISYDECLENYEYVPETGEFLTAKEVSHLYPFGKARPPVWRKPKSTGRPHLCLNIRGIPRRATHIAYLLMTREHVPQGKGIFFRDGNPENLRWDNLVLLDFKSGGKIPEGK